MGRAATFYSNSVGKKIVMAGSGAILLLFVIGHLVGNLQIFIGPEQLNGYAHLLKATGELLWLVRIILILCVLLHVIAGIQVWLTNKRARPVGYAYKKNLETGLPARTMIYGGLLIAFYVAYHLMMFTFLTTGPGYSPTDVYHNEILAFRVPAISLVYIVAMVILGMHLYHGIWSMFHTLGINYPTWRPLRRVCTVVAVLIALGYISIPVAVLAGWIS